MTNTGQEDAWASKQAAGKKAPGISMTSGLVRSEHGHISWRVAFANPIGTSHPRWIWFHKVQSTVVQEFPIRHKQDLALAWWLTNACLGPHTLSQANETGLFQLPESCPRLLLDQGTMERPSVTKGSPSLDANAPMSAPTYSHMVFHEYLPMSRRVGVGTHGPIVGQAGSSVAV